MMHDDYVNEVLRRGRELGLLEQAAAGIPEKSSPVRWVIAAAFGLLVALFPSAGTAYAFFQLI